MHVCISMFCVCRHVSILYILHKQSATCVFWSANENVFLTDVALGRSNVLAQQCLARQRHTVCHQPGTGWGGDLWGAKTDTSLSHVANAHVDLEIENKHRHL